MLILKENTKSLCNVCLQEIPAAVYSENNRVIMKKKCSIHGEFESLVENDVNYYIRLSHIIKRKKEDFNLLTLPITYKCNLDCEFCYLPNREKRDLGLNKIKETISGFNGQFIALSGGEPTLREDLPEIIKFINDNRKVSILLTNGLRLAHINYVKILKQSKLDRVMFSFDGFDPKVYKLIKNSEGIVKKKLGALENLKKEKIATILSMTMYRGINEDELKKVFNFAVENNSFIYHMRIRSCAKVGKYKSHIGGYFMSELIKLFEGAVEIKKGTALVNYQCKYVYYTPHSVDLKIYFWKFRQKIIFMPFLVKLSNKIIYLVFEFLSFFGIDKKFKNLIIRLTHKKLFLKQIIVHFAVWPSVENIDLRELEAGNAHLYDGKIINFCHAIVLNDKL